MAASQNPFIAKLKKDLTCNICKRLFDNPTMLSCLHSFCSDCLVNWYKTCKESRHRCSCPTCKKPILDGTEIDVSKPRISFYLTALLPLIRAMEGEQKRSSPSLECASCETAFCLVGFCLQCSGMVCTDCVQTHKAVKHLRQEHRIIMFTEFKQENLDSFVKSQLYCKEDNHKKEKLEIFCREAACRRFICQKCSREPEHKDHDKVSILEETKSIRQVLRQDVKELKILVANYTKETEKIQDSMARTQSHFERAKNSVRDVAEKAFKLIMEHEAEMIRLLNEEERKQKSECQKIQGNLNSEIQDVSDVQHQYERLLENNVACEIIETRNFLQKKCHRILDKETMLLKKPLMKGHVTVDYVTNPDVMQSLQNVGKLVETKPLDPSRCTIEALKEVRNGYFNELEFEIVTRDCDGEVCCMTGNFEIKIFDQEGNEIEKNVVLSEEEGRYRAVVTYKAEKKSPCEIQVNIAGERIKNSPQIVNMT